MAVQTNAMFHNRFDIHVRDAETGDIIQQGQAENIILNRMYDRLCTFSSYFSNIVFGGGEGVPTPERDTLFSRIGYKAASTVETVKDFPVSKWTRKITLGTSEFNGNVITEVGISDHSTNINTHAMITDAEGHPLSIEKTNLLIIDIYATVFISLSNKQDNIYFVGLPNNNSLLNYLTGSSAPESTIVLQNNNGYKGAGFSLSTHSGSRARDGRTVRLTASINETSGNTRVKMIDAVEWLDCYRVDLPDANVFEGHQFYNMMLGVGDGLQTKFPLEHGFVEDVTVYVNGAIHTNTEVCGTLYSTYGTYHPSFFGEIISEVPSTFQNKLGSTGTLIIKRNKSLEGYKGVLYGGTAINTGYLEITGSNDLESWTTIVPRISATNNVAFSDPFPSTVDDYDYIRLVKSMGSKTNNSRSGLVPPEMEPMVNFTTPPAEGAVITADYFVPYIPKDENYVLKITMEIVFGEGV